MKCKIIQQTRGYSPSVSRSFRKAFQFLLQVSIVFHHHSCRGSWCRVMFPSARGWCDVEHWQPSAKIWWGQKGHLCWKRTPPPSSLKAYHSRAEVWHHHFVPHLAVTWRATRSVTQRLTSPSVDLHLNTAVSGATARKYILFNHPSIFWGSETQGTVWLLIPSIPRILINWGLCPGQLVYLTVRQYTISLIDDWL